jgi:hypothetical protein
MDTDVSEEKATYTIKVQEFILEEQNHSLLSSAQ